MNAPLPEAPEPAAARRTAWLLFAPPALLAALRWLLDWQEGRGPQQPVLPLTPLTPPSATALELFMPALWVLGALLVLGLAAVLATRRWGGARVRGVLAWAWALLWLAGSGALLERHLNLHVLQPLSPVHAEVLGSRPRAPSLHATGGTELVLRVDGLAEPRQVVIDDPQAAQWRPGQRILLHWAHGRARGLFVTRWQAGDGPAPALAY